MNRALRFAWFALVRIMAGVAMGAAFVALIFGFVWLDQHVEHLLVLLALIGFVGSVAVFWGQLLWESFVRKEQRERDRAKD